MKGREGLARRARDPPAALPPEPPPLPASGPASGPAGSVAATSTRRDTLRHLGGGGEKEAGGWKGNGQHHRWVAGGGGPSSPFLSAAGGLFRPAGAARCPWCGRCEGPGGGEERSHGELRPSTAGTLGPHLSSLGIRGWMLLGQDER